MGSLGATSFTKSFMLFAHFTPDQVLFTADLKAFASYGLPTPSPTPQPSTPVQAELLLKSSKLSKKRRKGDDSAVPEVVLDVVKTETVDSLSIVEDGGLAERVKRRKRETTSMTLSLKTKS